MARICPTTCSCLGMAGSFDDVNHSFLISSVFFASTIHDILCKIYTFRSSISFLQFRHLKHGAQKAVSPDKIAKSSIFLLQTLQLYIQLSHMSDPSPTRRSFASESGFVPQVLHRTQSVCHRWPADEFSVYGSQKETIFVVETYQNCSLFLPRVSKGKFRSLEIQRVIGLAERLHDCVERTSPHPIHECADSSSIIDSSGNCEELVWTCEGDDGSRVSVGGRVDVSAGSSVISASVCPSFRSLVETLSCG